MNAVSMNHLWAYLQGLSLTASNRKWLAEKLTEPIAKDQVAAPPVLQTWEEAIADLDESEREFERGDVLSGEEFNIRCQVLIDSFAPDGVDFYPFKIERRLAMPGEHRRSKLSTFFLCIIY